MFTVANLLDHLSLAEATERKKIEKILKLTKKQDRQRLEIALQALSKLGIIETGDDGLIKRLPDENLIEARLRCSSKGYCFAVRDDGSGDDIYIRDNFLNHAWNGDRVLVKISREAVRRRSPEGKVQCILERSSSHLLTILETDEENLLGIPLDDRILTTIKLNDSDKIHLNSEAKENLVEVEIDKYPIGQYESQGHVVRPLPLDAGNKGDIDILLTKSGLQENALSPRSTIKSPSDKNRKDLTNQPSLVLRSWIGKDSPPLPAIHVEPNSGGVTLWVHSPTVAERVSLGNNLDQWLSKRSEAHCLGQDWNPLLSKNLSDACKFEQDKINKALTVELEISSTGVVKDWDFYTSEIKPVAEIGTEQLRALASRKPKSRAIPIPLRPIKEHIIQLQTIIFCASKIIENEKDRGLIELDLPIPELDNLTEFIHEYPESAFDQWKLPLNQNDPQSILSPLIRVANRAWHQHAVNLDLPSIFIQTVPIDNSTLNEVFKSAIALDLQLELDEDGITSPTELANAFSKNSSSRVLYKLLRHALPMPKLSRNIKKDDINISSHPTNDNTISDSNDYQSPWCCPGLHYYDIINQHILLSLLKEGKTRSNTRSKSIISLGKKDCQDNINWPLFSESIINTLNDITSDRVINQINIQNRRAKTLKDSIVSMAQARSAEPFLGKTMEAFISGVQSYGFFAEIIPSMAEGLVHVSSLNDDWYEYRSRQSRLVGRKSKKVYQLGDLIKVKLVKIDILRNQIDLEVSDLETDKDIENENPHSETSNAVSDAVISN